MSPSPIRRVPRRTFLALGALAPALPAASGAIAQSFNLDINTASGAGAGLPSAAFGGPAATPGSWNGIPASGAGPYALTNLNGSVGTVTLSRTGSASAFNAASASISGDYKLLFEDFQNINAGQSSVITIAGLAPGDYEVFTCAIAPDSSALRTSVSVAAAAQGATLVGGVMPANTFTEGVTHARHTGIALPSGGSIVVTISGTPGQPGSLNALQVKQVSAGRLYVRAGAPNGGDGRSWASAFNRLEDALAAFAALPPFSGGAAEIWVAQGTYRPSPSGDRAATFMLPENIRLLGGFSGSGGSPDDRSAAAYPTILSGDLGVAAVITDNSYNVVTARNIDSALNIIDGFTITGGYDNTAAASPGIRGGGGMRIEDAAIRVSNIIFRANTTTHDGGALWIGGLASPRIVGCTFLANTATGADYAGAVYAQTPGFVEFVNSRFLGNTSLGQCGAVFAGGGAFEFVSCVFSGNRSNAFNVGALGVDTAFRAWITNCTFVANTAAGQWGGLVGGAQTSVSNCIFWNNADVAAATDTQAAQIALIPAAQIDHCTIQGYTGPSGGTQGNSASDPKLKNPAGTDTVAGTLDDDPSLVSNSPAIDSGNTFAIAASGDRALDVAGLTRLRDTPTIPDTGLGAAPVVDRGAYEWQALGCPADFNMDGFRTVQDIFDFLAAWFSGSPAADFNSVGGLTVQDLFDFLAAWFAC